MRVVASVMRTHDNSAVPPDSVVCENPDGTRVEVLTGVVPDVQRGQWLLVHAGAALLRIHEPESRG